MKLRHIKRATLHRAWSPKARIGRIVERFHIESRAAMLQAITNMVDMPNRLRELIGAAEQATLSFREFSEAMSSVEFPGSSATLETAHNERQS